MYLQRLEIQGFKSFATKTVFLFPTPVGQLRGITAVVGPNGSGKSNVADAIRWVLGEQSKAVLRSKKAEDVIFFGSQKKSQLGFCEVSLIFNNEDKVLPVDFSEVAITRRLYRDGDSEYYLNKNKVRLADITLMIAQANFGAKSISVIGQGMIDSIINAPASERKEYFDEAAGVKQYQIKKDQSIQKLKQSRDNLTQARMLVTEIEPKIRFFNRQLKRLEERGAIEKEFMTLARSYYNVLWSELSSQYGSGVEKLKVLEKQIASESERAAAMAKEFAAKDGKETLSQGRAQYAAMQHEYDKLTNEKQSLLSRQALVDGRLQGEFERAGESQLSWLSQKQKELTESIVLSEKEHLALSSTLLESQKEEQTLVEKLRTVERELSEQDAALKNLLASREQITHENIHTELSALHALKISLEKETVLDVLKSAILGVYIRLESLIKKIEESLSHVRMQSAAPIQKKIEDLQGRKQQNADALQQHRIHHGIQVHRQQSLERGLEQQKKELKKIDADHAYFSSDKPSEQRNALLKEKEQLAKNIEDSTAKLTAASRELNEFYVTEKKASQQLLELQRQMATQQRAIEVIKDEHSHIAIDVARLEAHQEELRKKIIEELRVSADAQIELAEKRESFISLIGFTAKPEPINREWTKREMDALKKKLEQIGAIDPEALSEYESTKERYEFLTQQILDLETATVTLIGGIKELNNIIKEKFNDALENINEKFDAYFKILFSGGTARLTIQKKEVVAPAEGEEVSEVDPFDALEDADAVSGVEIYATPPQKKLKNISVLSGGEKAMTAIALLCAIVSSNPAPFVVLDEVDAALDDSNANRFADILQELVTKTQFIIVTHNRVTIHTAQILYGITMGDDGISKVLSLDIANADGIVRQS